MEQTLKQWMCCVAALVLVSAGCGGEVESGQTGDGGGPAGDGMQAGADLFTPKSCSPACVPPETCSVTGVCVQPGECVMDLDCGANEVCDPTTQRCVPAEQCGIKEIKADAVPPNLLVVLDRSCSMKKAVGSKSKWAIAVQALTKLLNTYQGKIRFGLSVFPDTSGSKCGQDAVSFPVKAGQESAIKAALQAALKTSDPLYPDGPCVTNIDSAMQQAASHKPLKDASRASFVLLITDGKQYGCNLAGGDSGTTKIIKQLYQQQQVATFVVGFGGGVDPAQLDIFAQAGGVPSADPATDYYKAEDQPTLDQALAKIGQQTIGCKLKLGQVPPNLDKIYVYFDNQEIAKDPAHNDGWDLDSASNSITFFGPACARLESGKVKDVDVVYGCKKPVQNPEPLTDGGFQCPDGHQSCNLDSECPSDQTCLGGCCTNVIQ